MTEQIEFQCKHCGKRFSADPQHAGRKSKCSSCKQPVRVPNLKSKSVESSDSSSSRPRPEQKPEPVNVAPAQPDETIQAALREAEQSWKLINESLENASKSDDPDTKLMEIDFAKQNLDLLKQHLATYPAIEISSFGDLEDRVVTLDSAFEQAGLRRLVANTHVESEPALSAAEPAVDKTIRFSCPECTVEMTAPASSIGQQFQCPNCQQIGSIPRLPSADTTNTGASAVASTKAANITKKTLISWKASYESLSQDTKRTTLLVGLILSITVFFIWPYISHGDPASNRRRAASETNSPSEIKSEDVLAFRIVEEEEQKKGGSKYVLLSVKAVLTSTEGHTLTESTVETTLRMLLRGRRDDRGESVDGITVSLYESQAHLDGGKYSVGEAEWWPQGHSFSPSNEANISNHATHVETVNVFRLPSPPSSVVDRLPEEERRQIYTALIRSQDRADREAERKYPIDTRIFIESDEHTAETKRLMTKYKNELLDELNISEKELNKIRTEGLVQQWPFPNR
jgi:hypothetical protein